MIMISTTNKLSLILTVALMAVLATAGRARADEPPSGAGGGETHRPSERLQVLSADATAVGLFALGGAFEGKDGLDTPAADGFRYAALGGYLLGGPIVHITHGHPVRAGVSLLLRAALPLLGAGIGRSTVTTCSDELFCGLDETMAGLVAGTALASAIDVALLSSVALGSDAETARAPRDSVSLAPQVAVTPQMAFAGLGGRF